MIGMAIAAVTTVALIVKLKGAGGRHGLARDAVGVVVGGGIGAFVARKVEMTKMPELVAACTR
jgi:NAD(P) transhydrogenase subunit beta